MTQSIDNTILQTEGTFSIVSINISEKTGTRKHPVQRALLVPGKGIAGDAHAGILDDRQVSLLAIEDIEQANESLKTKPGCCTKALGLEELNPGDFAENITTRGINLHKLPIGTELRIGDAILEVSRIGKECHAACEIRTLVGDCIMPRRGIFARVIQGGTITNESSCYYRIR